MHELSIAMSIVDLVINQAEAASADRVYGSRTGYWGTIRALKYESLEFSLGVATKETMLEKTLFRINRVEACGRMPWLRAPVHPGRSFSVTVRNARSGNQANSGN